jgi:hypothetical protein
VATTRAPSSIVSRSRLVGGRVIFGNATFNNPEPRAGTLTQRQVLEDLPSETGRPRSSCVDTTDTRTFAEYRLANRGKFGITFAYRIGDNTEQKRAAAFLLVPFESPAERPPTVSALAQKTRWSWLWIAGTG